MIPEVQRFKSCIGQYLKIDDWQALEILLAAVVAHKLKGEMLWLRIIGASGSGKTEILRSIIAQEDYIGLIESLTPSALRRGFQLVKRDKETDELKKYDMEPKMLDRIDGKLVITKELAPLLTRHHDTRLEIFGLLRSVHDGELVADYGSMQGHLRQKCWFDWIMGTTQYVDSQAQLEMQLGSRFTDLRWGSPMARKGAVAMAVANIDNLEAIRAELAAIVGVIIAQSDCNDALRFTLEDWFLELVDIVAILRTPVERDGYNKEVKQKPSPELGTRVGQNFSKIAKGLHMIGIDDTRPYITRMAWDAIPPNRNCVLRAILDLEAKEHKVTQEAVASINGSGLSQQMVSLIMKDMEILGARELPWREFLYY